MNYIIERIKKYNGVFIVCLFISIILFYLLIKGDQVYFQIHDNMDSDIAWYKMMRDGHLWWSQGKKIPFLGGIDRDYMFSDLKLYSWIHMLFQPFYACVIGWMTGIIIAISGFVFLGRTVFDKMYINLFVICGFLYGILPVFPSSVISFMSIPLILAILIVQVKDFKIKRLFLILLYPILSEFSLFGIFIMGYIIIAVIVISIYKKRFEWKLFLSVIPLGIGYFVTEWRLIGKMLFSEEESIRTTFAGGYIGIREALSSIVGAFVFGQYHSGSQHTYWLLPVCLIYFCIINFKYIHSKEYKKCFTNIFNILFFWQIFNCIIYGINSTKLFTDIVAIILPPLSGFNFSRTLWFCPFIWYFSLMVILVEVKDLREGNLYFVKTIVVLGCLFEIIFIPDVYNVIGYNLVRSFNLSVFERTLDKYDSIGQFCSYKDFYSEKLFESVKEDIGYSKDNDWAVAYGMHPAVLQYSGIKTLDGYLSYYPNTYKERFRSIIAPYLEKNETIRSYYDNWGGRAYIFGDGFVYYPGGNNNRQSDILIDIDSFEKLGGRYIISGIEISNYMNYGLRLRGEYSAYDSPYNVYVYDLK